MNSGGRSARPSGSLGRSVPRTPVRPQCMHGVLTSTRGGAGTALSGAPPHPRRGPAHCRQHLTRLGCCGCWPVLMTGSRPEASTRSIRLHLARAHWRALRGRHVLALYGLGSGIENSKDSRSEDHSTLRKCHVWQLASARPYYLRSYPRPLPIPRKLSGEIAEGQRGAADHQRDFRDRWHFCRMDPVTEGRQCAEGPAPPLPWPWSRTRRQRRLRRRWKLCLACSVRL